MRRFLIVFCLLFCSTVVSAQQKHFPVSLEQRIAYTKALEEVYWHHMIWPASNSQPKPKLEKVLPESVLRLKAEDILRKSNALASYWNRPITTEHLQKEIERMAAETLDPGVLQELWSALDNDPYLIAECLARPLLVERFTKELPGFNQWWDQKASFIEASLENSAYQYRLPRIGTSNTVVQPLNADANSWNATTKSGAPAARNAHTAVWTGTEMIVWGGWDSVYHDTGGRYSPSTNSWVATSTSGAPAARTAHAAVWTGTEMIVWGGFDDTNIFKDGGRYNPLTDSWVSTTTTGAPAGRYYHTAVWTGSRMIVWGGGGPGGRVFKSGGRYDPSNDSWAKTKKTGAPSARAVHTAVWTGTEMIVWGGHKYLNPGTIQFDTGGRYNPSTNSWTKVSTSGAPYKRSSHTAVWTGTEMIIWGGSSNSPISQTTGGRYNPTSNSWKTVSTVHCPSGRYVHTAVWTGTEMIVWGGFYGSDRLKTGARYNPVSDSWSATKKKGAPAGRGEHTAVWSGTEMIVWGGTGSTKDLKTGGRYTP